MLRANVSTTTLMKAIKVGAILEMIVSPDTLEKLANKVLFEGYMQFGKFESPPVSWTSPAMIVDNGGPIFAALHRAELLAWLNSINLSPQRAMTHLNTSLPAELYNLATMLRDDSFMPIWQIQLANLLPWTVWMYLLGLRERKPKDTHEAALDSIGQIYRWGGNNSIAMSFHVQYKDHAVAMIPTLAMHKLISSEEDHQTLLRMIQEKPVPVATEEVPLNEMGTAWIRLVNEISKKDTILHLVNTAYRAYCDLPDSESTYSRILSEDRFNIASNWATVAATLGSIQALFIRRTLSNYNVRRDNWSPTYIQGMFSSQLPSLVNALARLEITPEEGFIVSILAKAVYNADLLARRAYGLIDQDTFKEKVNIVTGNPTETDPINNADTTPVSKVAAEIYKFVV